MDQVIKEEVKENITSSELAAMARQGFGCFTKSSSNPVKIYLPTGVEFKSGTVRDNPELYACQLVDDEIGEDEKTLRLCILGPGAVGKSCIVMRFMRGIFNDFYDPTIEDSYRKHVKVDGRIVSLDILDTAGQEDFNSLRTAWYREKDGFLLVFSQSDHNGLTSLGTFYDEISNFYEMEQLLVPPIIMLGNKADLVDPEKSRPLLVEASEKAKEWNAVGVMSTSAKTGLNIEAAFANLARAIRRRKIKVQPKKKRRWCEIL